MATAVGTTKFVTGQDYSASKIPACGVLTIAPAHLSFGVVSSGFFYTLKFTIQNNSLCPIRIRTTLHPREDEKNKLRILNLPDRVAPGMLANITVELTADFDGMSCFDFRVVQNLDNTVLTAPIDAHIVTADTFKYVRKSLELQKRPIYRPNVAMLMSISGVVDAMTHTTNATLFSEALIMDDEDINDLLVFPMVSNVYWDPFDKMLRIDPRLGGVVVDETFEGGVKESIRKTTKMREERLAEIEEQGFLTLPAMERLREDQQLVATNVPLEIDMPDTRASTAASTSHPVDDTAETATVTSQASTRVGSVSSLLAMKRGKIESMRRATVNAATAFAMNSKKDTQVNSMRTLTMIQSRIVGIKYDGEQIM